MNTNSQQIASLCLVLFQAAGKDLTKDSQFFNYYCQEVSKLECPFTILKEILIRSIDSGKVPSISSLKKDTGNDNEKCFASTGDPETSEYLKNLEAQIKTNLEHAQKMKRTLYNFCVQVLAPFALEQVQIEVSNFLSKFLSGKNYLTLVTQSFNDYSEEIFSEINGKQIKIGVQKKLKVMVWLQYRGVI